MRLAFEQSFATAVRPSERVLRTASMFGLGVDEAHRLDIVPRTEIDVPVPGVVLITGPSGGGKSTVLRLIGKALRERGAAVIDLNELPPLGDAPLVDVFNLPLERAASLLAIAGLGDAFIMLRRPCELSDGQRARLRLAQAMHLAAPGGDVPSSPAIILADEFTATLDRITARIIARNVRRWIDRAPAASPVTFIAATTHEDVLEPLGPDVLIYKGLGEEIELARRPQPSRGRDAADRASDLEGAAPADPVFDGADVRIEPGDISDFKALAPFHYRSERAGVVTGAFRLVHEAPGVAGSYVNRRSGRQIVGVLLRSLPHLGCSLRDVATQGRYRTGLTPRESAIILNREMRTISRVVIHPQWRGLGLAVALVRHALAHPEPGQAYTEALAAMGHVHPFFERAGMTRFDRPPRREHARLLDALGKLGIEPYMLASPSAFLAKLHERDELTQVWFEHELARWCRGGARRGRRRGGGDEDARVERGIEEMLATARDQLLTLPVYYVYHHASRGTHAADSA